MAIPFDQQFFVEKDRNNKYEWLIFVLTFIVLAGHGILFYWIPRYLRVNNKRNNYFRLLKVWDAWTSCVHVWGDFYFQPSLVLLGILFVGLNVGFCFAEINDLDYQSRFYIISKRLLKVAVGNLPILLFAVMKNDLLTSITGLQHDRLEFVHKWLSRLMWVMITIHMGMACYYWLNLNFKIMIMIPPQIFGFMAYGSFSILNWASLKFIRQFAYDFFLVQHRIFAFMMLFFTFIHNQGNRAVVLISVHGLVIDRVVSKVFAYLHAKKSPTKGRCTFRIIDDSTISVVIPVSEAGYTSKSWYTRFLPKYKTWKAGQHIYLNVGKIKFFQYHPFTISSLAESGEMKLLIRVERGFTRKLMRHLEQVDHDEVTIKAMFHGPYGARYQPLITFDTCLFFAAGSGGAFTFPVCLDLLNQIDRRDQEGDVLFRPKNQFIKFVWAIRKQDNIEWFEDSLKQFAGRCSVDIYITQETKEELPLQRKNLIIEITKSLTNDYSILYGRPQIQDIIQQHSQLLGANQSMAVTSCGSPSFTNSIKHHCQSARRVKGAPEVYCYTESF